MGCYSWSVLPGPGICAGFTLGKESPCAWCYAAQGNYRFANVQAAQAARWSWWKATSVTERAAVLTAAIGATGDRYFRVYDSGDAHDVDCLASWGIVARDLPSVRFWLPTRSWRAGGQTVTALRWLARSPNMAVRLSVTAHDKAQAPEGFVSSSVSFDSAHKGCPKQRAAGTCQSAGCRSCWNRTVSHVTYRLHGHKVRWGKA